jgi:putative two-component system hydrogenase maturation factor HypX/HoxX
MTLHDRGRDTTRYGASAQAEARFGRNALLCAPVSENHRRVKMTQHVLILTSADNGLTQRAALALRRSGRRVRTEVVACEADMQAATERNEFDLIVCPFLTKKIPASIHEKWTCVIVHPGPVGDRGPSSLDWAIAEDNPIWGVIALSAVEEMDAGPIWASRTFPLPLERKTEVYNTVVADAAIACILETVDKALDPTFKPLAQQDAPRPVGHARTRPVMRLRDRQISWSDGDEAILRLIHAGDGMPGTAATIAGHAVFVYDARLGRQTSVEALPGTVIGRHHHALEVATRHGSIWVGHLRSAVGEQLSCKGPAVQVLATAGLPITSVPINPASTYREIRYRRDGEIGNLIIDFYNGAMGTSQCRRLAEAIAHAARQDTKVLVLQNDGPYFSNGIHLGAIELARDPAVETWQNLLAINAVCRAILACTNQVTIAALTGNAGAGGVMLSLGADVVVATNRVVLNPHYQTLGLFGSELHTHTLPRRVGATATRHLLTECQPIDTITALELGLIDQIAPNIDVDQWLTQFVREYTRRDRWSRIIATKHARRPVDLDACEGYELERVSRDIFHDEHGFHDKRRAFILKGQPRGHATASALSSGL